jgi:hypothetical protein
MRRGDLAVAVGRSWFLSRKVFVFKSLPKISDGWRRTKRFLLALRIFAASHGGKHLGGDFTRLLAR